MAVATRALDNFDGKPFPSSLKMGSYAASAISTPVCDPPSVGAEVHSLPEVVEGRAGLLQGIKFALGMQAATAFCFFAVWFVWYMFR